MAKNREQKSQVMDKVRDIALSAKNVVFLKFHGLGMSETKEMRRSLRDQGVGYFVAKKSLTRKALEGGSVEGEMPQVEGEMAIAWSEDEIAAAREVFEFQKKYKEAVSIQGGIFENRFMNQSEMTEVAQIPSLHVLRGMFVNVINSPIQGMAIVLSETAKKKEGSN
jgi:large subunit ribosomal protein L10